MTVRTYLATNVVYGDGITTDWPFAFAGVDPDSNSGTTPYIHPQDVKVEELIVSADDVVTPVARQGSLIAPNVIRVAGAPVAMGNLLRIFRNTERRYPLVDYRDNQSVGSDDLDLANRQAVFIGQEAYDAALGAEAEGEMSKYLFLTRQAAADAERIANQFGDMKTAVEQTQASAEESKMSAQQSAASAGQSALFAQNAKAAADAANLNSNVFESVTAGLAGTVNGAYFSVPTSEAAVYLTLYRNNGGTAVKIKVYPSAEIDSLTINIGKDYPLRARTRSGITSVADPNWNAAILKVEVIGAREGEVYQLAFLTNGAVYNGKITNNWLIKKFDDALLNTADPKEEILVRLGDTQPQYAYGAGIQTVRLVPWNRPEMTFVITLDTAGLPPYGTGINSNSNSGFPGWSWIIDKSCYQLVAGGGSEETATDSLTINGGQVYPLNKALPRAGVVSADYLPFRQVFLDVAVHGADPQKLYRIAYIRADKVQENGVDVPGVARLGFILEEFSAAEYETTGVASRIHNYTDTVGIVKRDTGSVTVAFKATLRPDITFTITMDSTKLPEDGKAFAAVNPNFPGLSWIIDKNCYYPTGGGGGGVVVQGTKMGVYYTYNRADRRLQFAYLSGAYAYRITFRKTAINQLPNLTTIERAPRKADLETADWTVLSDVETDYYPPMIIRAINNGDDAPRYYTGGSHGSDGSGGGVATARCVMFDVYVDGQMLTGNASGWANEVTINQLNELMAYNTIAEGRYTTHQHFRHSCTGTGVGTDAKITALEPIQITTDNGPQAYFGGFNDTQMLADSEFPTRTPLDSSVRSGSRTLYPKAWALLMKSTNGTMVTWMDRSFEAGDGRYVHPDSPFIRGGGTPGGPPRAKFYHAAVAAMACNLALGESYRWRGGYLFCADTGDTGFDTKIALNIGGVIKTAIFNHRGDSSVL